MLKLDFNIIFTIINLLVLYFLFKKFLFDKVNDVIRQRQELVDQEYAQAQAAKTEARSEQEKYEQALAQAQAEADGIIREGREKARDEYDRVIATAQEDARKELDKARETIARDREDTLRQIKSEVGGLVALAAGKVMEEGVSREVTDRLYAEMMAEAGEGK